MSSARTWPERIIGALRRLAGSALWRLTLAFAAPLALGAALFVGATYVLMVTEDSRAAKTAVNADVATMQQESSNNVDLLTGFLGSRVKAHLDDAKLKLPITTYYRFAVEPPGKKAPIDVRGDAGYAPPAPVDCSLWLGVWGPCVRDPQPAPNKRWYYMMQGNPAKPVGLAARLDVSGYQGSGPGAAFYVGHVSGMRDVEAGMLSLAVWTMGLAAFGAVAVGLVVGRGILRRIDALNAVLDRVREGAFEARANEAGDDEFGTLGRNVNLMLGRINHLVLHAQDVSDRIAHDLRRPIANLRSRLERLGAARTLAEAQASGEAAVDDTDSILASFQSLLHIGELYAGADKGLQRIDLADSVRKAVLLYEVVAEEAGVGLTLTARPAPMLGNEGQLMLLINNLVDNAIKYSPRGGAVTVNVGKHGGQVVLRVTDQGPGIAEDEREAVFKPFVRGASAGSTAGHGQGLAEVDAVIKRHAARRRVEDAHPTGADITVEFRAYE